MEDDRGRLKNMEKMEEDGGRRKKMEKEGGIWRQMEKDRGR